jgi:broad specificity polyphosphatase/5'/3'-nucleotidase SurE
MTAFLECGPTLSAAMLAEHRGDETLAASLIIDSSKQCVPLMAVCQKNDRAKSLVKEARERSIADKDLSEIITFSVPWSYIQL